MSTKLIAEGRLAVDEASIVLRDEWQDGEIGIKRELDLVSNLVQSYQHLQGRRVRFTIEVLEGSECAPGDAP